MSNLGTIAAKGLLAQGKSDQGPRCHLRTVVCGTDHQTMGARDNTEGDPAQPSLRMDRRGRWRFRWTVLAGTRTISVRVKQAVNLSPRPSLVIKANTSIGVNADSETSAASGAGWITIGPVTINPSANGAVWVELRANYDGQSNIPCYWDQVVVT
jgi:hypothetical protein